MRNILYFHTDREYDKFLDSLIGDEVITIDAWDENENCSATIGWGHRGTLVRYEDETHDWYYRFKALFHKKTDTWLINLENVIWEKQEEFNKFMREHIILNKHIPWKNG